MSAVESERPVLRIAEPGADPVEELIGFLAKTDARTEMDLWMRAEKVLLALELPMMSGHGRASALAGALDLSFRSAASHESADKIAKTIAAKGVLYDGNQPAARTLLEHAETVYVWEPEDRVAGATFAAHRALKSPKYAANRSAILRKLVAKSPTGRATTEDVKMWRQSRAQHDPVTFIQLFDRRIVSAIRTQVRPSFKRITQEDLDAMGAVLNRRAKQLAQGVEPKETN